MILIVDNQSNYIKKFLSFLENNKIDYFLVSNMEEESVVDYEKVQGIILSGGPKVPEERDDLEVDYNVIKKAVTKDIPILGFCLGHEIIANYFKGKISYMDNRILGLKYLDLMVYDEIMKDVPKKFILRKQHYGFVSKIPENFVLLASSSLCPIEIIKHKDKNIYGFQGHPETLEGDGLRIMLNFLKMCGYLNILDSQ